MGNISELYDNLEKVTKDLKKIGYAWMLLRLRMEN